MESTYASAWKRWTVFMQVCHHNPTTVFINCAESTQQQVVRLLLMFAAYCLDALG